MLDRHEHLEPIADFLKAIKPMPAVFDQNYVKRLEGKNVKTGKTKRELAEALRKDIRDFKAQERLRPAGDGLVRVDRDLHQPGPDALDPRRLREGDGRERPTIAPSMLYAYAAIRRASRSPTARPT